VRRVAGRYFVQTPNRGFPIEPHSLLPLVHLLPPGLGRRLWRFGVSTDPYESARLLGARELRRLFPDARIVRERFGPMTKSLVAAGPAESLPRAWSGARPISDRAALLPTRRRGRGARRGPS
jgi:hypothetical protein